MSRPSVTSHPYLDELEPYEPPDLRAAAARSGLEPVDLLRLSANENQFGPSPRVAQALADSGEHAFYPNYAPLREAIARYAGVAVERVVLTNGADEAIDLLIRLFAEPGQIVVTCPPTSGMYEFCAKVNRCRVLPVPRQPDFSLDVPAVEQAVHEHAGDVRLLFIASPGNPHGLSVPLRELEWLLDLRIIVAVDEAYIEFGGESAVSLLDDYQNLVVIRTFSKWAGLAGLRLGYALLAPPYASLVERIRAPYNVNSAAVAAGLATLDDLDTVRANVRRLVDERERIRSALARLEWLEPLPSEGNFVLCRVRGGAGSEVAEALALRGILVQAFLGPRMGAYFRFAVGRPEQNDAVLQALATLGPEKEGTEA